MSNNTKLAIGVLAMSLLLLTPIAAHAQTEPTATSTTEATATIEPTATETIVPTATETVVPTATSTVEPSPTSTVVPTATSTIVMEPSLSVSPSTVVAGDTVTATWSNIPDPSATDWLGLYQAGAPDMSYISWVYVSGSATPSAPMASGSVTFTIPDTATPGSYEIRLFADNGYVRLATSSPVMVSEPTPTSTAEPTSTPTVTNTPEPTSTPTTTPTTEPVATSTPTSGSSDDWRSIVIPTPEGDRKANHGWFVSWIARFAKTFEDIRHGLIVSFFARSDLGKDNGEDEEEDATATPTEEATAIPTGTAQPTATVVPTATSEPTATQVPTVDSTVTPTVTPTSGTAQETSLQSKEQERQQRKEERESQKELEKQQRKEERESHKEKNRNSLQQEEQTGQTYGFAPFTIDKSETPSATTDSSGSQSPGSRGPKEGRKVGDSGDVGSPPFADEEEVFPGRSERRSTEVGQKRDEAGNSQRSDPKPSSSGPASVGRNR